MKPQPFPSFTKIQQTLWNLPEDSDAYQQLETRANAQARKRYETVIRTLEQRFTHNKLHITPERITWWNVTLSFEVEKYAGQRRTLRRMRVRNNVLKRDGIAREIRERSEEVQRFIDRIDDLDRWQDEITATAQCWQSTREREDNPCCPKRSDYVSDEDYWFDLVEHEHLHHAPHYRREYYFIRRIRELQQQIKDLIGEEQ